MWPADDPREKYKRAEQRLRTILLGDGTYEPGVVHGEEQRAKVAAQLRVMREAIDGLTQHEAELAEELLNAAQRKAKPRPRSRKTKARPRSQS